MQDRLIMAKKYFEGIYKVHGKFATQNLLPGQSVYGEKLVYKDNHEYRIWDLFRSKLAGALAKGLEYTPFGRGSKILYLGASTGTTISHMSDIVGKDGLIFGVEISATCMPPLIHLAEQRGNIAPIIEDANHPERLDVPKVDLIYQDIAQRNQVEILLKNIKQHLKPKGFYMLCVKSQSIDVTKSPQKVYQKVLTQISKETTVLQSLELDPYDKHHMFIVGQA